MVLLFSSFVCGLSLSHLAYPNGGSHNDAHTLVSSLLDGREDIFDEIARADSLVVFFVSLVWGLGLSHLAYPHWGSNNNLHIRIVYRCWMVSMISLMRYAWADSPAVCLLFWSRVQA